ncbi:MAG TPA: hypothetical protein VFK04_15825 [Gemmatimonadaceae bacterium]|nr:hypothetical protein [Gemmatimonadaceae bacterium]
MAVACKGWGRVDQDAAKRRQSPGTWIAPLGASLARGVATATTAREERLHLAGRKDLHSVAGTIEQLAPRLPAALVATDACSRLMHVAGCLPAALTNWIYLECRLRRGESRVDLIVRVDQRGRDILTGDNPVLGLAAIFERHPVWRSIRALARAWSDPSSPLYRGVERIWLEFDVHASRDTTCRELPVPGVFIEFAREVYAQHRREDRLVVTMAALRPFMPEWMTPAMSRNLRRCWELLPSSAAIPYVGQFPARGSAAVRVSVAGLSDAELPAYLRALRWPGSHRDLTGAIAAFRPPTPVPLPRMGIVNLDVDDELGAGVGIEYVLSHAAQLRGSILEREILDHLVRVGFCSAAKSDALLAWPATSLQVMPHELWRSRACRRVNHLKLSLTDAGSVEVKAYLAASHEYHPARHPAERATVRLQHSTR